MKDNKQIEEQSKTFERLSDISKTVEPELFELCESSKGYLERHRWCKSILDGWLALYWEGVLSICLFRIDPLNKEIDDYVWIVDGDIPPAYIDIESAENPKEVLESYVAVMSEWAENILEGRTVEESYPVEVPPTIEYATMLKNRLDIIDSFIEEEFD